MSPALVELKPFGLRVEYAAGNPASTAVPWPAFNGTSDVLSLVEPQPQVDPNFATAHNCSFWAAG